MNTEKPKLRIVISFVLFEFALVIIAFSGGVISQRWFSPFDISKFKILKESYNLLDEYGLKSPLPEKQLEYGMVRGMLDAYHDPYTVFVEPPQHELQTDQLQGKYGGIGVRIEQLGSGVYVIYPYPDSPALKAGIFEGDILNAIDALQITGETSLDEIEAAIRGPVGSTVVLQVTRPSSNEQIKVSIKREEIAIPSVTSNIASQDPRVGVVKVNIIAETTPDEITKAIDSLVGRNAKYFILDLRNNSGGLVEAGVNTVRLFLKDGTIIQEQYRGKPVKTYQVEKAGLFADIPLVVLINNNTASSAEIVAGSLKARHRVLIIGVPSYGKDTIQLVFDLQDQSSLHITAAHWWVPGLNVPIAGNGVQPDIEIPDDESHAGAIMEAAIQSLIK